MALADYLAETTPLDGSTDEEGRCARHPFVQLRCRSRRTGAWRSLLDSCPLCAADDRSVGASACSAASASVAGGAPAPGERGRTRSPAARSTRTQGARSASRVRFPAAEKMARRLSSSAPPPPPAQRPAPKALKAPKYKVCKEKMQQLLDESEKERVTFMSEDLSLSMSEFWNSMGFSDAGPEDDDGSVLSGDQAGSASDSQEEEEELTRMLSVDHEEEKKRVDEELTRKMEKKLRNSLQLQKNRAQMPLPEDYEAEDRSVGSGQHKGRVQMLLPQDYEREERHGGRGRQSSGAHRSAPQRSPSQDSSRDASLSLGSARRKASGRSRSSSTSGRRHPPGGAPSRRSHSLRPSAAARAPPPQGSGRSRRTGNAARVGPDPEEFPCRGRASPRSPSQDSYRSAPGRAPPPVPPPAPLSPSQDGRRATPGRGPPPPPAPPRPPPPADHGMTLQAIQRMPLEATPPSNKPPPPPQYQGPNYTGMVVTPDCADVVSVLSFTGNSAAPNSVTTGSSDNSHGSRYQHGQADLEEDPREDEDDEDGTDPTATLVNTADYDSKGRCIHHHHIRLRKKKMFGRGWKTLMSACPDCCVDELRRIRVVDEKKRKMAKKKLERAAKNTAGSARSLPGPSPPSTNTGGSARSLPGPSPPSGSARSVTSALPRGHDGDRVAPGSQRQPPRAASVPPQLATTAHPRRSPSQEGYRLAPGPAPGLAPRAAAPRPQGQRSPSQDSRRAAPAPRRSPSQDSCRSGSSASSKGRRPPPPPPKKAPRKTPSDGSTSTASLTESEQLNGSDRSGPGPSTKIVPLQTHEEHANASLHRNPLSPAAPLVPEKKTRSRSSSSSGRSRRTGDRPPPPPPPHGAPTQESPQLGTIHVRMMQWTDAKGNLGRYTGQVNAQFVPYGHGSMAYDASHKTKAGEWKNGKYLRRSSAGERSSDDGPSPAPRSRSRSRTAEGGGRSRSQGRSASRAGARQRSTSRQSQPTVAVFS